MRQLEQPFHQAVSKNAVTFSNSMPRHATLDHAADTYEIRKLRNHVAKLQEEYRLTIACRTSTEEFTSLMQKIVKSPHFDVNLSISQQIDVCLAKLEDARHQFKRASINKWRDRMKCSASRCYKWLKSMTFVPFRGLISSSINLFEPTNTVNASLTLIRDHWRRVWHRPHAWNPNHLAAIDAEIDRWQFPDNVSHWSSPTKWHFSSKAMTMNHKAAGPDGWTGSEIAALSPDSLEPFANFCNFCELASRLPSDWNMASQVHIPKGTKGLRDDGTRDVTGLRPLALFSVWYRLWSSVRLQHDDTQAWISSWWPDVATGGKKGQEIYHALIPLIHAAAQHQYLISLDFSLAFDYCDPRTAIHVLRKLRMPEFMCRMLLAQWTNQRRYVSFQNFYLPEPEHVSRSLPQGDPWSLLAMVAVLCPAMLEIKRLHPQVTQRNFVDDRSWAAPSVQEALAVGDIWDRWTHLLGLINNESKAQYYHATPAGRRNLLSHNVPAANVTDQICILGHVFRPSQQRSLNAKEQDRINSSLALLRRAACLPLSIFAKRLVMATGPLSKVQFGWLMHTPPANVCDRFQSSIRKSLNEPKRSCVFLRDIFRGHNLHMGFRILQTCVNAVHRFVKTCPLPTWTKLGVSASLNKQFERMSWLRIAPWTWRHAITDKVISLDPSHCEFDPTSGLMNHRLREGFRAHSFEKFKNAKRNDSDICATVAYCETRCKAARRLSEHSSHSFAILTGGYVSRASYARGSGHSELCPHCQVVSSCDHEFWVCPHVPNLEQRPTKPTCPLQARLGWPCVSNNNSEAILAWQCQVRKFQLNHRYKPPSSAS